MTTEEPKSDAETQTESSAESEAPEDPMTVLERERDQYKALAQRTQADFINYKRRTDEERGMLARNASNQVLGKLLPVLDDLRRAIAALPSESSAWGEGVKMTLQNFESVLESEGLTAFEPAPGDTFDPSQHEAVSYQPTNDQPPGAVLMAVRGGYRTADRILRAAQVVVASEPDKQEAE